MYNGMALQPVQRCAPRRRARGAERGQLRRLHRRGQRSLTRSASPSLATSAVERT